MEPEYYKNEIQKSIDEIDQELEIMQDRFIQSATLVGYTRSAIKAFGNSWVNRIESSQSTDFSIVVQSEFHS